VTDQLTIRIAEDGAGAERADALVGYLRDELRQLDVADVIRAPRGGAPRTVRIEMDGGVLELTGASSAQQDALAELFVRRHGGA
jgi:HSP20 family molecular chaperone IbpA